ncbi:hypothetical protein G6F68_017694 [Rhizopus microsporus]|nr:hypothetical protein G6F68_017694 [Rhizopus microsporus]
MSALLCGWPQPWAPTPLHGPPARPSTRSALRDQPRGAQPFAANSTSSARSRSTVPTSVQRPRWCCPVINPCAMKCFCSGTTENFGGSRSLPGASPITARQSATIEGRYTPIPA